MGKDAFNNMTVSNTTVSHELLRLYNAYVITARDAETMAYSHQPRPHILRAEGRTDGQGQAHHAPLTFDYLPTRRGTWRVSGPTRARPFWRESGGTVLLIIFYKNRTKDGLSFAT